MIAQRRNHELMGDFRVTPRTHGVTTGHNRERWTQFILPVSGCGTNASVRVSSNLFPVRAPPPYDS
jgi:hypothetical protein